MSRKIRFLKEASKNQEDNLNLDVTNNSSRILFQMKRASLSGFAKRTQTEYIDIPKIGRKIEFHPPQYFQHRPEIHEKQFCSKNFKTELSETCSVNLSSLSLGEREKKVVTKNKENEVGVKVNPIDHCETEKRESKRKTITDFVAFFFNKNYSLNTKISKFFKKLVFPHFISIIISIIMIIIQQYYDAICFIKNSNCSDGISVKIYTTLRACIMYWNMIIALGYITVFHVDFLKKIKILKFIYIGSSYATIFYYYIGADCSGNEPISLYFFLMGMAAIAFFFFIYLIKIKFDFKLFLKITSTRVNILTLVFLNYLMNYYGYKYLRSFIEIIAPFDSINVFQLAMAMCVFISRTLFKMAFYKHAENEGISQKIKLDSIGIFVRICVCIISATEVSNMLQLDLSYWGVWVMLINHVLFLLIFYTRYNFPLIILNKIIKILLKRENYFKESEAEKLVDKLLAGYMIDFQFILIPRLLTLYIFKRWLNNHIAIFYSGCDLEISDSFVMRKEMVHLILGLNVSITLFVFIWMYRNNKHFFIYIPEKIHIFKRAYIILMVHTYFEYVMQEVRQISV